jgi:quaternary ammonium compound-resistance protein SugE
VFALVAFIGSGWCSAAAEFRGRGPGSGKPAPALAVPGQAPSRCAVAARRHRTGKITLTSRIGSADEGAVPALDKTDSEGLFMSWFILVVSGVLEAVWATALAASHGFRRLWPTVVFVLTAFASMVGLAYAMTELPTGTSYAVWVGIGATLTVVWGIATGAERATLARILLLTLLVGCVIGLKVVS